MAANPKIQPYTRSPLPTLPGSERQATNTELQKLEMTIRSLTEAVLDAQKRIAALEAKVP